MFIDEATIYVRGGDGGCGLVSFHKEKYIAYGGPSGGDGGRGGNVYLIADTNLNTLLSFKYKSHFHGDNGKPGQKKNKTGKSAGDLYIKVPPGTVIKDCDSNEILCDLTDTNQRLLLARGGRGGRGNARFPTSTNQAPRRAEKGELGEERTLRLELKLLADAAIIGYPNAGKSTLISRVSAAKPKIADYPFTTLAPNLGVVKLTEDRTAVFADIPGLIEGAHKGTGLGYQFLRHIERTKILIHVLSLADIKEDRPLEHYYLINKELQLYNSMLSELPQIVAGNKIDLPDGKAIKETVEEACKKIGIKFYPISAVTGEGVPKLLKGVTEILLQKIDRKKDEVYEIKDIFLPRRPVRELSIEITDGKYIVTGDMIEKKVSMTYLDNEECLRHLQKHLYRSGIIESLEKKGIKDGDTVVIADYEFSYSKDTYGTGNGD
ncbi:MAG: GTPase ObgE [Candidatus Eremiobacterota bacterium]